MFWIDSIRSSLDFVENKWVAGILTVCIVIYGGLAAPKLPAAAASLFRNKFFNLAVIFLIAYLSIHRASVSIAIVLATAFMISIISCEKNCYMQSLRDHFSKGSKGQHQLPAHIDWNAKVPMDVDISDAPFTASAGSDDLQGYDETMPAELHASV